MAESILLYASTADGLFILSKPGTSKEWLPPRHVLAGQYVLASIAAPGPPIRVAAVVHGEQPGLYVSANGGRTWEDQPVFAAVTELVGDPTNANIFYAGVRYPTKEDPVGRKVIDAVSWSPNATRIAYETFPPRPAHSPELHRSNDGGATWTPIRLPDEYAQTTLQGLAVGTDIAPILVALWEEDWDSDMGPVHVLAGDGTGAWRALGTGLVGQVDSLAATSNGSGIVFATTEDGIWQLDAGSAEPTTWELLPDSDPGVIDLLVIPAMKRDLPVVLLAVSVGRLVRSEDGGASWQTLTQEMGAPPDVSALIADPLRRERLYAGTSTDVSYDFTDAGDRGITAHQMSTGTGAIYTSADRGKTWTQLEVAPLPAINHLAVLRIG